MSLSAYLTGAILAAVFTGKSFAVSDLYVSLHTDDPGMTGANEVRGGKYLRKPSLFKVESDTAVRGVEGVQFDDMPAVTLSHYGLWDSQQGGRFLWGGTLSRRRGLEDGDAFRIPAGSLYLSFTGG